MQIVIKKNNTFYLMNLNSNVQKGLMVQRKISAKVTKKRQRVHFL